MKLTGKGKFLILLSVLFTITAWLSAIPTIYIAPCFCLSILIFEFFATQTLLLGLKIERVLPKESYEDDEIMVKLLVNNHSIYPKTFMEIQDVFPPEKETAREKKVIVVGVRANSRFECTYPALCYKRGGYRIGPCTITSSTPLRIFVAIKTFAVFTPFMVFPRIFKVKNFPIFIKGSLPRFGEHTSRLSGDYEEFYGIREYHREDGWRRIHWRSTARLGELMVKHFEQSALCEFTIIVDARKGHDIGTGRETTLEYAVKIAASLANYLMNKRILVQLVVGMRDPIIIPPNKGREHYMTILEGLAATEANGDAYLTEVINMNSCIIPSNSTLIILMLDIDINTVSAFAQFKAKGVSIIPIILNTATFGAKLHHASVVEQKVRILNTLRGFETAMYYIQQGENLELKFL